MRRIRKRKSKNKKKKKRREKKKNKKTKRRERDGGGGVKMILQERSGSCLHLASRALVKANNLLSNSAALCF